MPTPSVAPPEPTPDFPPADDVLYWNVREALAALPFYFETETVIKGLNATDIFTLNTALGATIEEQVVATLNKMRPVWDPDEAFTQYGFVRQPQTFPDVLLKKRGATGTKAAPLLGIELKGWYLLAKEEEPSFRFKVTPAACATRDLLVVVPWALSDVISGSPRVFEPYIEAARFAATFRNHWWQHIRETSTDATIKSPQSVGPYPAKSDRIADRPVSDSGSNFGRLSRTGIMSDYLAEIKGQLLSGIRAEHWLQFFSAFKEKNTAADTSLALERLRQQIELADDRKNSEMTESIEHIVTELSNLLKHL